MLFPLPSPISSDRPVVEPAGTAEDAILWLLEQLQSSVSRNIGMTVTLALIAIPFLGIPLWHRSRANRPWASARQILASWLTASLWPIYAALATVAASRAELSALQAFGVGAIFATTVVVATRVSHYRKVEETMIVTWVNVEPVPEDYVEEGEDITACRLSYPDGGHCGDLVFLPTHEARVGATVGIRFRERVVTGQRDNAQFVGPRAVRGNASASA